MQGAAPPRTAPSTGSDTPVIARSDFKIGLRNLDTKNILRLASGDQASSRRIQLCRRQAPCAAIGQIGFLADGHAPRLVLTGRRSEFEDKWSRPSPRLVVCQSSSPIPIFLEEIHTLSKCRQGHDFFLGRRHTRNVCVPYRGKRFQCRVKCHRSDRNHHKEKRFCNHRPLIFPIVFNVHTNGR